MCNAIPILLATLVLYTFILCAFCSSIDCELVFIRSDWLFFIPSHSLTLFTDIEINFVLCSRYLSFCLSVHHLIRHQNKNDDESIKFATSKILFRCLSYFVIDWLRFFFKSAEFHENTPMTFNRRWCDLKKKNNWNDFFRVCASVACGIATFFFFKWYFKGD